MGRDPRRFLSHSPRCTVCGFDNQIIAHTVWLKILSSIVTIIVVVVDVAGTYGSAVLPFISWISAASIDMATSRSVQWAFKTVALLMGIELVATHCNSKGSFKGHYEQLWVLKRGSISCKLCSFYKANSPAGLLHDQAWELVSGTHSYS